MGVDRILEELKQERARIERAIVGVRSRIGKNVTLRDFYRSLPVEQYPYVVALAEQLTSRTALEEFEFGLGCLLDGVEMRLQQSGGRRQRSRQTTSPG